MIPHLEILPVPGLPMVGPGDDLAALIDDALREARLELHPGDVLAVAQKIVSKAEGRMVRLADVVPREEAVQLAAHTNKDPRVVELILRESTKVVKVGRNVIITEHRLGLVMANAGIDRSNVSAGACAPDTAEVLLLPEDPDASAAALRASLGQRCGVSPAVIVTDSIGRPWRLGTLGTAIGSAGIETLVDLRGRPDLYGRALEVSEIALADSLASAAVLVMGEGAEGVPVALVRGLPPSDSTQTARALLRPRDEDLFR